MSLNGENLPRQRPTSRFLLQIFQSLSYSAALSFPPVGAAQLEIPVIRIRNRIKQNYAVDIIVYNAMVAMSLALQS